jgi:hypothetical protein
MWLSAWLWAVYKEATFRTITPLTEVDRRPGSSYAYTPYDDTYEARPGQQEHQPAAVEGAPAAPNVCLSSAASTTRPTEVSSSATTPKPAMLIAAVVLGALPVG